MGIGGEVNNHWDYEVKLERRHLDNASTRLLDRQARASLLRTNTSNTVTGSLTYTDGEKIRVHVSLEGRRDQDVPKLWQMVTRNSLEYQLNPDLSFRSSFNYGISRFRDPEDRPADFVEFNTGFAYRPVDNDRLNILARYTYLRDIANDAQFQSGLTAGSADTDEIAHILAMDLSYDLHRYLGMIEKIAYKSATLRTAVTDSVSLNSLLWATRFNFHVTRKWDLAVEYRVLWQSSVLKTLKHGALFEIDREFYDYVRIGVGYDFTDFDDDLRSSNDFSSHGPFVRLTGKF